MDLTQVKRVPGVIAGALWSPLIAIGSAARRARLFHPRGTALWGRVSAVAQGEQWHSLAASLEGQVLVRFSGAWWKNKQWPDVLGCALRFTHASTPSTEPTRFDQDLLLATVRVPATTLLAPLATRVDDYLKNAYFGVSPFRFADGDRIKLRLTPALPAPPSATRAEGVEAALEQGPIRLLLEGRLAHVGAPYLPIASMELLERVELDQAQLRFDPYRNGRDLTPDGFVHAMRIPAYAASRTARQLVREPS